MLTLSWLDIFMWDAIFAKAHQVYSAVIRSEIMFEVLTWHQWKKEENLSNKERRLEILQNQALHYVADAFKKVNITTLKTKIYTSSLHVHLNKLQNWIILCSQINDRTQKIKRVCELIHAHLININSLSFCFSVIKKTVFLNILIHQEVEVWCICKHFFATISTNDWVVIAQYHRDSWNLRWENYKTHVTNIAAISAQRSHLFSKSMKMREEF